MYMYIVVAARSLHSMSAASVNAVKASRCNYRIAGIFRGVKFLWFSWLRGVPRNFYPRNSTA